MGRSSSNLLCVVFLLGILLVVYPHPALSKQSPKQHKASVKKAVADEFWGWVDRVGQKHAAKQQLAADSTAEKDHTERAVASGKVIIVDQAGKGQYKTVQAAVNSISNGNSNRVVIQINAGTYKEKILVPKTKPYVTFQGAGADKTTLVWDDTAGSAGSTSKSASTAVESDYFIASGISFKNSAPAPPGGAVGKQAVAFRIKGDKAAFYDCSFYGAQDTLYDQAGRHYFKSCFIQGSIDFIFGDGQSYYEGCHLNSFAKPNTGSLTAQKRSKGSENTGYSFVDCTVTGTGPIYLGRAWGPYSRVVFIGTYFEDLILPVGWQDWDISSREKTVYYGQYQCSGPGANTAGRVKWSHDLTAAQAAPFESVSFVDGELWLAA